MLLMKHTVVFRSWCPPATAQQNPTQAPKAKIQGLTWRSLSVGRTEKAGDNVVVEKCGGHKENTEKYLRGRFQHILFKKNTSQIRDTIQFWTISICCWKMLVVQLPTWVSSCQDGPTHVVRHKTPHFPWVPWCSIGKGMSPTKIKCFVWFYMVYPRW